MHGRREVLWRFVRLAALAMALVVAGCHGAAGDGAEGAAGAGDSCPAARARLAPRLSELADRLEREKASRCEGPPTTPECVGWYRAALGARSAAVALGSERPGGVREALGHLVAVDLPDGNAKLEADVGAAVAAVRKEVRAGGACAEGP